ncbi:MAG: hypothetical protein WKF75_04310 [Singulisphaera sp.]
MPNRSRAETTRNRPPGDRHFQVDRPHPDFGSVGRFRWSTGGDDPPGLLDPLEQGDGQILAGRLAQASRVVAFGVNDSPSK